MKNTLNSISISIIHKFITNSTCYARNDIFPSFLVKFNTNEFKKCQKPFQVSDTLTKHLTPYQLPFHYKNMHIPTINPNISDFGSFHPTHFF